MITTIEFALMAGVSYRSNRDPNNRFPVPSEWMEVAGSYRDLSDTSGFEAVSFVKGTEIVISFAGTGSGWGDWLHGNTPLALGVLGIQLKEAADYYLQIKAANPNAAITLTGHSLGGGLAALIAVMIDETAVTFDQAPFNQSALFFSQTDPVTGDVTTTSVALALRDYLSDHATTEQLIELDAYISANVNTLNPIPARMVMALAANEMVYNNINERKAA